MIQRRLTFRPPKPRVYAGKDDDARNLEAARIYAADPERYAGAMMLWAERVLKREQTFRLESK